MRAAAVLISNLLRLLLSPLIVLRRWRSRRGSGWVRVQVQRQLSQLPRPVSPLRRVLQRRMPPPPTALSELRTLTDALARDPHARGLLLSIPHLAAGWASCEDLRGLLVALRGRGKRVVVHLREGGGQREMLVASGADEVLMSPGAQLQLLGVSAQAPYFGGLFEHLGVRAQVQAVGDFKTAGERFERRGMSEAQRAQVTELLQAAQTRLLRALGERPLRDAAVDALFERGLWPAADAMEVGLVDGLVYEDGLPERLGLAKGQSPVAAGAYLAVARARVWRPVLTQPYIAVVPIHGAISMGVSPLRSGGTALEPTLARLRAVALDSRAVGVLLDVDSPGGSALASDLIHHEVERLAADKPVVARFGEVAASGGYYVAAAARRIVAQPLSVTGSIGVISGKLVAQAALERHGVRIETLRMAPHADMFGLARPWSEDERGLLEKELGAIYRGFLEVVARGRQRTVEEVEAWAGGRVWSGERAEALGLVDRLGDFEVAMEELRALLPGLSPRARAQLRARLAEPPPGPLRPPEPAYAPEAGSVWTQLSELQALLQTGEPALCFAADVPALGG